MEPVEENAPSVLTVATDIRTRHDPSLVVTAAHQGHMRQEHRQ